MIAPVSDAPCWVFAGVEESPHYLTHDKAIEALQRMPAGVGVEQMPVPCYQASCSGCGFIENDASEGSTHIPAYEPRHVRTELYDLRPAAGGRLLCRECAVKDPTTPQPAPAEVIEFLDWLLAWDDAHPPTGNQPTFPQVLNRAHQVWSALGLPPDWRPGSNTASL
jgi:hypothetical protein